MEIQRETPQVTNAEYIFYYMLYFAHKLTKTCGHRYKLIFCVCHTVGLGFNVQTVNFDVDRVRSCSDC